MLASVPVTGLTPVIGPEVACDALDIVFPEPDSKVAFSLRLSSVTGLAPNDILAR